MDIWVRPQILLKTGVLGSAISLLFATVTIMPEASLDELKPPYLETIELLRACRKQELGKTGATEIPIAKLRMIAPVWKINRFFTALAQDDVIEPINELTPEQFDAEQPGGVTVHCLKTIEEIQQYRYTLQGQSDQLVQFPISSWVVLEIRFTTDQEVLVTANEASDTVRKQLFYADIGFADGRDGSPDESWELLMFLAHRNGILNPSEHREMNRNQLSQRIRHLRKKLKNIFCLDNDPFEKFNRRKVYQLKFPITYPSVEE